MYLMALGTDRLGDIFEQFARSATRREGEHE
jgi:hypothetical protein